MNDEYFGTICLCALRYALGRQTYMPGIVQEFIRAHISEIDQSSIKVMLRDIEEARKDNCLGMDCDVMTWLRFYEWLKGETDGRN